VRKSSVITVLIIATGFSFSQNTSGKRIEKVKVSGTVQITGTYCGGAYPGEQAIQEMKRPKPLPSKKLYLKAGRKNDFSKAVILAFISDSVGRFSISLAPGDYCIVDEVKKNKSNYDSILKKCAKGSSENSSVDKKCLLTWFLTPDAVFTVGKEDLSNVGVMFYDKCSWEKVPCINYTGPLPP